MEDVIEQLRVAARAAAEARHHALAQAQVQSAARRRELAEQYAKRVAMAQAQMAGVAHERFGVDVPIAVVEAPDEHGRGNLSGSFRVNSTEVEFNWHDFGKDVFVCHVEWAGLEDLLPGETQWAGTVVNNAAELLKVVESDDRHQATMANRRWWQRLLGRY